MHSSSPTNHIRMVIAGMSGSSMFDTEARTSGNGLSSSSIASKSNSILEVERVSVSSIGCFADDVIECEWDEDAMAASRRKIKSNVKKSAQKVDKANKAGKRTRHAAHAHRKEALSLRARKRNAHREA